MTARVGLRVVTTGLRASQATCSIALPRICALNMKPIVPTFGFNLGSSFVSKKLFQTISCPHSLEIFYLHPLFRFERNLFISNFKRQQFLHNHLWGWGVWGKAHCPGESDKLEACDPNDSWYKISQFKAKEGDNLLDVAINNDIDLDGFGACEGTLACSTCHVIFTPVCATCSFPEF